MTVRESGEMYLEAILVLAKKSGYVRSIDVSEYLGYSKPSVSRAMGILREGGYILVDVYKRQVYGPLLQRKCVREAQRNAE